MMTGFNEAKNIVNNRSVTANNDNVKDFEALTPTYFLIGRNFYNNSHLILEQMIYVVQRDGGKCSCLLNTSGLAG